MRITWYLIVLLTIFPWAKAQEREIAVFNPQGVQIFSYSNSYALVIGASNYQRGWGELPTVAKEMVRIKKALHNQGFQVSLLKNPNSEQLKKSLHGFLQRYGKQEKNRLLIYFAGHGYTYYPGYSTQQEAAGYLVPVDAPNPSTNLAEFFNRGIPLELLKLYLNEVNSKHILFVLDCSVHCEIITPSSDQEKYYITRESSLATTEFLIAGKAQQPRPSQSDFAAVFVSGLAGKADLNSDGYVLGAELATFMQKNAQRNASKQTPVWGKLTARGDKQGDYIFKTAQTSTGTSEFLEQKSQNAKLMLRMEKIYQKGVRYTKGQAPLRKKGLFWQKFLRVFSRDLPNYQKDNQLRHNAQKYITLIHKKLQQQHKPPQQIQPDSSPSSSQDNGFTFLRTQSYTCGKQTHKVKEYRHNQTGMEFVLLEGGTFMMGSQEGKEHEKPLHKVTLTPFLISKHEVTQEVWQQIMGNNPSHYPGENMPVENVSWQDAQEFCKKTHLDLPTEAQWEYACRGGSTDKFCFGNDEEQLEQYAVFGQWDGTYPVMAKKPNAYGLYDMHGNVWEWCQDWYGDYTTTYQTDPQGPENGKYKVCRGGSWNFIAEGCHCGFRDRLAPSYRSQFVGFRVVKRVK